MELVCDYDLHDDRDRDLVLVVGGTGFAFDQSASRFSDRGGIASSDYVFVVNNVHALVVHALFDLLRGVTDVCVCILQHAPTVLAGVHVDATGR